MFTLGIARVTLLGGRPRERAPERVPMRHVSWALWLRLAYRRRVRRFAQLEQQTQQARATTGAS